MSPPDSRPEELVGRRLAGRYRLRSVMAHGGMATVFRADDERLEREVAVKVLAPGYAGDPAFVNRFLAEARTAASFSHPNLAHVYDSGSDGDVHFIALELLDRHRSLRDELRERGRLSPLEAAAVVDDVLAGLEPLHRRGLVHCDVKAGNVMVGQTGTKLIDFGIARPQRAAGRGRTSIGSLHAMSPEQLRGDELTPASDLFGVGVVLYEALTGRVPYPGETPEAVARAHEAGDVAPPSSVAPGVAGRLDDVALQALRPRPDGRFASAAAMRRALAAAIAAQRALESAGADDDQTTTIVRLPAPGRGRRGEARPGRRLPMLAALAAAGAVAALALVVVLGGPRATDGSAPSASGGGTPAATPTLAPGTVRVPNTIGLSEEEAEAAAREAGLAWRIEWRIVPGETPGIYDQEPPAGRVVPAGSRFVMYAYRSR